MARMSLSQAVQSVAGKQPVQPVPLAGNPYGLSPALAPQVAAGEAFLRNNMGVVPARRMSPPPPTPGSNAYRVAPAGALYNSAGQRDGRAMGVPYGPGAYPVINTHNPTMVVLPPRFDRFSRMQDNYNQFFNLYAPMFRQMMQQAMQSGRAAVRPRGAGTGVRGTGSAATPQERKVEDLGSWNAYVPGVDMRPLTPPRGNAVPGRWSTGDDYGLPEVIPNTPVSREENDLIEQQRREIEQGGERRALTDKSGSNTRMTVRNGRLVKESIRPEESMPWWAWQLFPQQNLYHD